IGDHTTPDGYTFGPMFGGDGTTFFPEDGNNQSPQIDSVVQPWTDLDSAQESWGIDGDVLSHFPDDEGTSIISNFTDWQDVAPPAGNDQTITRNGEGPSRLALSDFEGIEKYGLCQEMCTVASVFLSCYAARGAASSWCVSQACTGVR